MNTPNKKTMQELTRRECIEYFNLGLVHIHHPPRSFCEIRHRRAHGDGMNATFDENLRLHSEDGAPAFVRVMSKFTISEWYEHGKLHRDDDYAVTRVDAAGKLISAEWWYHGTREHVLINGVKYLCDSVRR